MQTVRCARLFRDGRNQMLHIPLEFEFFGDEVLIYKNGDRLILEPVAKKRDLLALLATLEPIADDFPDMDAGLLPLDCIK